MIWLTLLCAFARPPEAEEDPEIPRGPDPTFDTSTCYADFVFEGDVVRVDGEAGDGPIESPFRAHFANVRAIKGTLPAEVELLYFQDSGFRLHAGQHVLIFGGPQRNNPLFHWFGMVPVYKWSAYLRDDSVPGSVMLQMNQFSPLWNGEPDLAVVVDWSPALTAMSDPNPPVVRANMAVNGANGGLRPEDRWTTVTDDPKSLGARWDDLVAEAIAGAAKASRGKCTPPGVYLETNPDPSALPVPMPRVPGPYGH